MRGLIVLLAVILLLTGCFSDNRKRVSVRKNSPICYQIRILRPGTLIVEEDVTHEIQSRGVLFLYDPNGVE